MPNYSKTIIVGHVGQPPELRYTPSGDAVCNFSVAVSEKSKDKEYVTWYRVNAFKKLAEICNEYLKKGSPVLIEGQMQCRKWEDKEGAKRESWELRAFSMQMLGGKKEEQGNEESRTKPQQNSGGSFNDFEDDIPFRHIGCRKSFLVI